MSKTIYKVGANGGDNLALGETSTTAYRGDRGKTAFDHASLTNNPHTVTATQVGLGNVDNTTDLNKPISTATQTAINGKSSYHGFVNRTLSSFSFATTTLTLVKGSNYDIYINGIKYTITGDLTCNLSGQTGWAGTSADYGHWYIVMSISGGNPVLSASKSAWSILDLTAIPVAIIHWDGTTGIVSEERHSYLRNLAWHNWAHKDIGTLYESGFTTAPTFNTNNTFTFPNGVICDEDIEHTLTDNFTGSPVTTFTHCNIGYRVSGGASMTFNAIGTTWYKANAGNPQYDNNGTLTVLSDNNYGIAWIYGTNRISSSSISPIVSVVGQGNYANLTAAQAAPQPTLAGLTTAEWRLLYRVIYRKDGNNAGIINISITPLYNTSSGTVISSPSIATPSAGNVLFVPTGNIASVNVQAAIEELDTEKQAALVSGTTIKTLNGISILGTGDLTTPSSTDIDRLSVNLCLETFRRMNIDNQMGTDPFMDGWIDDLQDNTNITSGSSSAYTYDSGTDSITNTFTPALMTDDVAPTYSGVGEDYASNVNWRALIPASAITVRTGQIRVKLKANGAYGFTINAIYIGKASGSSHTDFASTPTQLLFSTSASKVFSANEVAYTDWLTFSYTQAEKDAGVNLIVSIFQPTTSHNYYTSRAMTGGYANYKYGASEVTTLTVTDYSEVGTNRICFIEALEANDGDNMTLVFNSFEADAEPTKHRIVAIYENLNSGTLNTDIKFYVSNDDGTNYEQVTMTDEGLFETNQRILTGEQTLTARSDKTTRVKVTTHNNKGYKLHAIADLLK